MNWRTLLGLYLAAAVAWSCAWLLWSLQSERRTIDVHAGFSPVFVEDSVPWSRVDRVVISRGSGGSFEFAERDGRWFQVQPFEFPIEPQRILELLGSAKLLTARVTTLGGEASVDALREGAGLRGDAPSITLGWKGGEISVRLGARLPAGFAWIDLNDGGLPRTARSTLHDAAILADLRQWRQTALFSRADVECDRLVAESIGRDGSPQRLEVVRDGPVWMVDSPIKTRADRAAVERWLEALSRSNASGFVVDRPTDLLAFGLEQPAAIVEIHAATRRVDANGHVQTVPAIERLEIGSQVRAGAQERFARLASRPDAILELDETAVAAAVPPTLLMIDPTATGQRAEDVRTIRFEPIAGTAFKIERIGSDWKITDEKGARSAMASTVDRLLRSLCESRASEIMLRPAPSDLMIGRIVLETFDGREIAAIAVSRERDGGRFGVDDGSGVLRVFAASLDLQFDPTAFEPTVAQP